MQSHELQRTADKTWKFQAWHDTARHSQAWTKLDPPLPQAHEQAQAMVKTIQMIAITSKQKKVLILFL